MTMAKNGRALLIDDDGLVRAMLTDVLQTFGYVVDADDSGEAALARFAAGLYDVVITDQRMPGMTGIELLKKTVPLRPRMVRIILTGYTDVDALVEAINCGQVYRYVAKPWDNEDLRLTVRRGLEHFESNKRSAELDYINQRLVSRIRGIQQLAMLDDGRGQDPQFVATSEAALIS